MIRYAFDLYPRSAPKDGTRIRRLTHLQAAEYREDGGTNSGSITLRANTPDGDAIDPEGLQYIRVVRINDATVDGGTLSGFSELVVGGFFLENGDYRALSAKGEKLLTFTGAGTLSYLDRAIMAHQSYLTDPFIGQHPFDDRWRLWAAGTGNELGAILWRVIRELQEVGRPQNPIPDLTVDFTYLIDSNGASWSASSGDFEAQIGERVLMVVKRLMEMGLWVEMDPDTFELRSYEPNTHARDRTGGAWGTNVVRFQSPTDGTIGTSNIKSDASRGLAPLIVGSDVMVGANDIYEWVNAVAVGVPIPPAFVWERSYRVEDTTGGSFAAIGTQQLQARADAGDVVRLRGKLGNSPTTGYYLPFEQVRVDDVATLHNGSGQWDWNEAEEKVAAVSILLREGGDWDFLVDLGSQYASIDSRAFAIAPVGPHSHPILLCGGDPATDVLLNLAAGSIKVSSAVAGQPTIDKTQAVDGDDTTASHWSAALANGVDEEWWAGDLGAAADVVAYRVRQGFSITATSPPRPEGASEMRIYGSNDSGAWSWLPSGKLVADPAANDWTQVAVFSGSTIGSDSGLQVFGSQSFRYWLLRASTGPAPGSGEGWNLQTFELWNTISLGTANHAARCDHPHTHAELLGVTPDQHHAQDHAAEHEDGGGDELEAESLATAETDSDLVLAPDGTGGVEWRAEAGGGGGGTGPLVDVSAGSTSSLSSFADTDMAIAVAANTDYRILCMIFFNTNATSVGIRIGFNGPASPTLLKVGGYVATGGAGTNDSTAGQTSVTAYDTPIVVTTSGPGATNAVAILSGIFRNGSNAGTLTVRHASETATLTSIEAGSYLELQPF